ncbi:hypothetical protein C2I18_00235 [Paenibacillus sp. PK3_47]|uniref:flagellar hook-length control protein FliK n=1 Tax=Paenibacillus sp. PK3_47 TaxID=2072642 RepID=UPI00201D6F9E|nr:flagellar hook-length control protein FliK [Paenibacillus sp. PK3_47]UQZ32115.1 hypothetical protein C2I18_00235 [Paenibacillus sp. PK3_47]
MSLVLQSFTGSAMPATGGTTTASVSGTAATGGSGAAMPFAQTLVQSMEGTSAIGTETPVFGNLASLLQGLLNAVQPAGEETTQSDAAAGANLLNELVKDLEKLDETISSDPALLEALQGWILQVTALLTGNEANSTAADTSGDSDSKAAPAAALSPLAQNPETLRFAVQDELNSLVTLIQQSSAEGKEETAAKGMALLNSFSAIVAENTVPENKAKKTGSVTGEAPAVSLKQPETTGNGETGNKDRNAMAMNSRVIDAAAANSPETGNAGSAPSKAENAGAEKANMVNAKTGLTAPDSVPVEETAAEAGTVSEQHEIVTAGQLSLRAGVTAPLKTEAPQVPVHQFAQEMDTFITGKLEIVRKGGVAEATITLFPENLGQVDVKITMQNGNLVAQFMTEHSGAKDMLEQQMNQLRAALQSQGLQVERLEVSQSNPSNPSQWGGQQGQGTPNGGGQQGRRSKERSEDNGDALLAAELNGEWKDWVAENKVIDSNLNGRFSAQA